MHHDVAFATAGWIGTAGWIAAALLLALLVRGRLMGARGGADGERLDRITGLLSRTSFEESLEVELERARRLGGSTALLVAELEGLDDLAEREARESALGRVGRFVRASKRGYDSAARMGDARLAILAPDCDEHGAYMLAERMRAQVERALPEGGLALSVGVAAFPLHGQSPDSLARAAEQALHAAASLGGDRAVISSAEVPGMLAGKRMAEPGPQVELDMLLRLAEGLDVQFRQAREGFADVARRKDEPDSFGHETARDKGER